MNEVRTLPQLLDALRRGYIVSGGTLVRPKKSARKPQKAERCFCVSIAGHTFGIDASYDDIYSLCKDYLSDLEPEIRIGVSKAELDFERDEAIRAHLPQNDQFLETQAIHRKISEALLACDAFLMHGAVVAEGERAYMFTAESGTGKTTHVKKWLENLDGAYIVNGDKPFIRIVRGEAVACGTPWCGKERMGTNAIVSLRAIILMERAEENEIGEISFGEAFAFLLQQTYQPADPEKMKKTLSLLSQLKDNVRFYRFRFNNLKEDAFEVAYRTVAREKTCDR